MFWPGAAILVLILVAGPATAQDASLPGWTREILAAASLRDPGLCELCRPVTRCDAAEDFRSPELAVVALGDTFTIVGVAAGSGGRVDGPVGRQEADQHESCALRVTPVAAIRVRCPPKGECVVEQATSMGEEVIQRIEATGDLDRARRLLLQFSPAALTEVAAIFAANDRDMYRERPRTSFEADLLCWLGAEVGNAGLIAMGWRERAVAARTTAEGLRLSYVALDVAIEAGAGPEAAALSQAGLYSLNAADLQAAAALLERARERFLESGNVLGAAVATYRAGLVESRRGRFEEAAALDEETIRMLAVVGGRMARVYTAYALGDLGAIHRRFGNLAEAIAELDQTIEMAHRMGDSFYEALTLHDFGSVYFDLGAYGEALAAFRAAADLHACSADPRTPLYDIRMTHIADLQDLARTYAMLNDGDNALRFAREALTESKALHDPFAVTNVLEILAKVELSVGRTGEAAAHFQEKLAMDSSAHQEAGAAVAANGLAECMLRRGRIADADHYASLAAEQYERLGTADGRISIETLRSELALRQGNVERAVELAGRAVEEARQFGYPERLMTAYGQLGEAERSRGHGAAAIDAFERAVRVSETLRDRGQLLDMDRVRFFTTRVGAYYNLVTLLFHRHPGRALMYADQAKARALLDALRDRRAGDTPEMRALSRQIEALRGELLQSPATDQARRAGQILQQRLGEARMLEESASTSQLGGFSGARNAIEPAEILRLVRTGEAILAYSVTAKRCYAFVISRRGISSFIVSASTPALREVVDRYRTRLASRDNGFVDDSRRLYDLLIAPAVRRLGGTRRLIIVPDGFLWNAPLQTLLSPRRRYLLEDYSITYAPSLAVYREMLHGRTRSTPAARRALIIASPSASSRFDRDAVPLPPATAEVEALRELFGTAPVVLSGSEATKLRVRASLAGFSVVHFATHGRIDGRDPLRSYLLLSGGHEQDEGHLSGRDILQLHLSTDIVFLAACDTATGRIAAGEGLVGLAWFFMVAGSRGTVVTLWPVDSEATGRISRRFYEELRHQTDRSLGDALRMAALQIMHTSEYRHPFYWAAFSVFGGVPVLSDRTDPSR